MQSLRTVDLITCEERDQLNVIPYENLNLLTSPFRLPVGAKRTKFVNMAKNKKSQQVLAAIRRNTGYAAGRTFSLVASVVTVVVCAGLGALLGAEREQEVMLAFILTGALGGVAPALLLNHLANAIFDGADSLVQVAKFQERSLRRRNDAIDLVEKIREEVESEGKGDDEPETGKSEESLPLPLVAPEEEPDAKPPAEGEVSERPPDP